MRIRYKLILYFLGVAVLVPVMGLLAITRVRSVNDNVQNLSNNAIPRITAVEQLKQLQLRQQNAAYLYQTSGKPEDRQAYLDLGTEFDTKLAELTQSDASQAGKDAAKSVAAQRVEFTRAGAQMASSRVTRDRNFDNLRTKDAEMIAELAKIRARYTPNAAASGGSGGAPQDATAIPVAVRNLVNDLLLGSEGMLRQVEGEWAIASAYTLAPDEALRQRFDEAGGSFTNWLAVSNRAGGPDDLPILSRVQTAFGQFESSARAMMAAADLTVKARVTFAEAGASVNSSLDSYVDSVRKDVEDARASSASSVSNAQRLIVLFTVFGFVFAGSMGFWFAGTITGPIVRLRNVVERVSTGDMSDVNIDVKSKDELGDLADAFRRMVASIRFLMMRGDDDGGDDGDDAFDFGQSAAS